MEGRGQEMQARRVAVFHVRLRLGTTCFGFAVSVWSCGAGVEGGAGRGNECSGEELQTGHV